MLTRRGRVLLAEGALLYLLARGISVGELYALSLACFVFPALAVVFVRWARHKVGFTRTIGPKRVFAGGTVRIEYGVRNLGRLPTPPLILDDDAPHTAGGRIRVSLPTLSASKRGSVAVERVIPARGRYRIGPLRARLVDPFGLAEATQVVGVEASLLVYPRIEVLHETSPTQTRGSGGRTPLHRLAVAGDEFYAVRDWQDGDDLRKVHWRSTARRGSLQIRQDENPPFPRATLLIDTRLTPRPGGDPAIEWAVSAAASTVWELARQGFALRLVIPGAPDVAPRWGQEAVDPLLGTLAAAGASSDTSMLPSIKRAARRPGAGGALLAILPPADAASMRALPALRSSFAWCGAVLLDAASFTPGSARDRAQYDQRLADAEHSLARAGWRVVIAGATQRFPQVWHDLIDGSTSRSRPPSLRS